MSFCIALKIISKVLVYTQLQVLIDWLFTVPCPSQKYVWESRSSEMSVWKDVRFGPQNVQLFADIDYISIWKILEWEKNPKHRNAKLRKDKMS